MYIPESVAPLVGLYKISQANVSLAATSTLLIGQDSSRVLVVLTNQTVNAFRVAVSQGKAAAISGLLCAGSSNFEIDFRKYGAICNSELWAFGNVGTIVTVTSLVYSPNLGE